ncbi:Rieske (2Fe-2S) protein [Tautonia sociabilis]|uniref:Rieske (2Fe-2S) protein n=1 Tax=Tautonia sociabilis TaxID=2080755 RepID=UPI001F26278C|nr:Rieske (2Fe-2S) protein [Tautonia sociabilis]
MPRNPQPVCRSDAIPEGTGRLVRVSGREVAVFNDGGRFFAVLDRCPHAGASLARGWVEEGAVVCPLHRWRFRLEDGRCESQGGEDIPAFSSEERGGWVWVWVEEPPGGRGPRAK